MKPIILSTDSMPVLSGCDFCMANESFFHTDRTPDFHILIYVVSGCIYVTEGDIDYAIHAGELLILQSGIRHYGKYEISKGTSWYYAHFYLEASTENCMPLTLLPAFSEPLRFQLELPKQYSNLEHSKIAKMIAELALSLIHI